MGGILDKLDEWLRGLLIEGITGNLSGMFDTVNTKVGEIAGEVGQTPLNWNSGVFSMIRSLSETVIVPIAGVILTFVMCYELIQLVTEKNNLNDVDTWTPKMHIQLNVSVPNLPRSRKNKPTATPQASTENRNCRIDSPKNMDSV